MIIETRDQWVKSVMLTVEQLEVIRKALADYQPEDINEQALQTYMMSRLNESLMVRTTNPTICPP